MDYSLQTGLKSTIFNYVGRLTAQIMTLFVSIYIIRKLPIKEFGQYNLLSSILSYMLLISSFGISKVVQRYIPEFWKSENNQKIIYLSFFGIIAQLLITVFFVGVLLVFSSSIGKLIKFPELQKYLSVYKWVLLINPIVVVLDALLTSLLFHLVSNLGLIVAWFVRGIGYFYVIQQGDGLYEILIIEVIAVGVRFIFLLVTFISNILLQWDFRFSGLLNIFNIVDERVRRYGLWSYLSDVSYLFFNTDTDNFIIANHLGNESVGRYGFASRIGKMAQKWMPLNIAFNAIVPLFINRYSESKNENVLNSMFTYLIKISYVFNLPILAGILAMNERLINFVFGEKYINSTWLLIGILSFTIINAYETPLGLVVYAIERNQLLVASRMFSILNLFMGLLLVRVWGVTGVLLATAVSVSLKNAFIFFMVNKNVKVRIEWIVMVRIAINSIIMGLFIWLITPLFSDVIYFIISITMGSLIYILLNILNNTFSSSELNLVNRAIGRDVLPNIKKFDLIGKLIEKANDA